MKYIMLIYDREQEWAKFDPATQQKHMGEYQKFTEDIIKKGHFVNSSRLEPTASSAMVQVRDGKRLVTDGPFAETREQIGGFYMVEARDLAEAVSIASQIPSAKSGTIEVRPVMFSEEGK